MLLVSLIYPIQSFRVEIVTNEGAVLLQNYKFMVRSCGQPEYDHSPKFTVPKCNLSTYPGTRPRGYELSFLNASSENARRPQLVPRKVPSTAIFATALLKLATYATASDAPPSFYRKRQ